MKRGIPTCLPGAPSNSGGGWQPPLPEAGARAEQASAHLFVPTSRSSEKVRA